MTFPLIGSRDTRAETTQPSVVGPGGVGQASFHVGAVPPGRSVIGVEHVDVGVRREVRWDRHAEQSAIPVVVDLVREIGNGDRARVCQALKDLDHAVLLADEDPAVRRELQHRRIGQSAEHNGIAESCRQGGRPCRIRSARRRERSTQHYRPHDRQPARTPGTTRTTHAVPTHPALARGRLRALLRILLARRANGQRLKEPAHST